mgnify:CR=1 FL=1
MKRKISKVSDSAIEGQFFGINPGDINDKGTLFGGRMLEIVDEVSGYIAMKHSRCRCFTRRCCAELFAPAFIDDVLMVKSSVNRVWTTSMEVGIKIFARNLITQETRHILSAYSTLVTIDDSKKPAPVPYGIKPITKDEKRRYAEADRRKKIIFRYKRP